MKPLVSVLIPAHNAEQWISETIKSVLDQTWNNIETIIVDDGSGDATLEVAQKFECSTLKVITQQNQGASSARNLALREAQGNFIQYLDADDVLSPEKIEMQVNALLDYSSSVAVCRTVYFFDGENYQDKAPMYDPYLYDTSDPIKFLITLYGGYDGIGGMIQPNAYLAPRYVMEKAGFWEEFYSPDDDGEYFCRVILSSDGIRFSEQGINYYRKYKLGNSLSGRKSRKAREGLLRSLDLKAQHLLAKTNSPEAKFALARLYIENAVLFYPAHRDLSSKALKMARSLDLQEVNYVGGKNGHAIAKFLGWRAARLFSHVRYGV